MSIPTTLLFWGELALSAPIVMLGAECLAAFFPRRSVTNGAERQAITVLIPAHNEALLIAKTLASIREQLSSIDRLTVIADNCSDTTATIAREAGAEVFERCDPANRGKGFALAWGLEQLNLADDSIVIALDADTEPAPGALKELADAVVRTGRPQQAIYMLRAPSGATPQDRLSAFACCLKNQVRLVGAGRLGLPSHLTGSGMAFRPSMLRGINLASASIVEDMQLGIDLAVKGLAPQLCRTAEVIGLLPSDRKSQKSQRRRWEHGHLTTMVHNLPGLVAKGFSNRRVDLVLLALDLAIPPLALLSLVCSAFFVIGAAIFLRWHIGRPALFLSMVDALVLSGSVAIAWVGFAQDILPLSTLGYIPQYILLKIPMYFSAIFRRQKIWEPTARS